jgi:hypothetical protein
MALSLWVAYQNFGLCGLHLNAKENKKLSNYIDAIMYGVTIRPSYQAMLGIEYRIIAFQVHDPISFSDHYINDDIEECWGEGIALRSSSFQFKRPPVVSALFGYYP